MKFSEKAKAVLESSEFSEEMKGFTKNVISAATGDVVAAAEAMKFILLSPMFIRECLFWEKFSMFIDGVFLEDEDIKKLSEIFAEAEEKENYARRIIKIIDDIDLRVKITYIINLTRSMLSKFINKPDYYRLINTIKNTMEEDLNFLSESIDEKTLRTNIHVEFLKQNGLTIQTLISDQDSASGDEYVFTPLAYMLDKYGLNYGNGKYQYSATTESLSEQAMPVTRTGNIVARFG